MQMVSQHKNDIQSTQFPNFWNEEWLKIAIDELDIQKMAPDENASFEILVARNAEAVNQEIHKKSKALGCINERKIIN
jgi:hypothetical protein